MRRRNVAKGLAAMIAIAASAVPATAGAATLRVSGAHPLGSQSVVLADEQLTVRGVAADTANPTITFSRGVRPIKTVALTPGAPFTVAYRPSGAGRITIHADGSVPVGVQAIATKADINSRGTSVRFLQVYLQRLRYGGISASGYYDYATARAVIAFRKVNRLRRTTNASPAVFRSLAAGRGAYKPRYTHQSAHVEADLTHQVIALVKANGRLHKVFITSSGRPSLKTPVGKHRIYKQERGVNSLAEYNISYFSGICGIHGYFVVPTYPHSHCCLRVPIPDSGEIRNFAHIGMFVDVFYRRRAT